MAEIRTVLSSSALLFGVLVLAMPSAGRAQSVAPAEASRHFERGYLLARQGSLEEAISEFKQAYALKPHPSVLYNLGQAYAASGRAVEAVDTLARFLSEAPASDAERRAQAESLMEYQSQRVGSLTLTISPPQAKLSLDGVALAPTAVSAPNRLTAGWHSVAVTLEGYEPRIEGVQITGKVSTLLSLVLRKKPPPPPSPNVDMARDAALGRLREERLRRASMQRTGAILGGGIGVASLAAAGILYASNQRAYADWRRDSRGFADELGPPTSATRSELDQLFQRENTLRNRDAWALGLAVFGGVMSASSTVLWLTLPRAEAGHVSARLGPEPWIGYGGTF
jgi:tetratricopeptide (TPR) repeat protein